MGANTDTKQPLIFHGKLQTTKMILFSVLISFRYSVMKNVSGIQEKLKAKNSLLWSMKELHCLLGQNINGK